MLIKLKQLRILRLKTVIGREKIIIVIINRGKPTTLVKLFSISAELRDDNISTLSHSLNES